MSNFGHILIHKTTWSLTYSDLSGSFTFSLEVWVAITKFPKISKNYTCWKFTVPLMGSKAKYFKDHKFLKNNYSGMHFCLPITMVRTPSHFVHVRILFKKILDKMQVKMIFELDNIWNDEGVVKLSPKNIKHLYVKCKIDAGKKMKGLNLEDLDFSFSSLSSLSEK